jgi:phosphoglycerate kinase
MSHLGKINWKEPDAAKIEEMKKENDMAPVAKALQELVPGTKVYFCPATRGEELKKAVADLKNGEILLLVQNTRYEKGEEKNDPKLAEEWAALADVFVMDAFGGSPCSRVDRRRSDRPQGGRQDRRRRLFDDQRSR